MLVFSAEQAVRAKLLGLLIAGAGAASSTFGGVKS